MVHCIRGYYPFFLLFVVLLPMSVLAQKGIITGTVSDSISETPLDAVVVYALSSKGALTATSVTDSVGVFHFEEVPTHLYSLVIFHPNHQIKRIDGVQVIDGKTKRVNVFLAPVVKVIPNEKSGELVNLWLFSLRKSSFNTWITIFIFFFIIYWIEFFRYMRLSIRAKSIPFLSSISIKGGIRNDFDSRHADLLLFSHISKITELYKRTLEDEGTLYGEVSEIRNVFPIQRWTKWKQTSELEPEQKNPIKIGPFEFYVQDLINILFWVIHIINPYFKRYSKLKFYVTLGSINEEMQLTVVGPALYKRLKSSANDQNAIDGAALTKLFKIVEKCNLSCISSMLRDTIFMIFQILHKKNEIPGRNWKGMKFFTEALESLELYSRIDDPKHLDKAIENFKNSALTDYINFDILYLQGYLSLVKRTEDSINSAITCLTNALKSEDKWLKTLINSALANCYAQLVHRFAKQPIILKIAEEHLKIAKEELEDESWYDDNIEENQRKQRYADAKIISAEAFICICKAEKDSKSKVEARKNYLNSAKLYIEAQDLDSQNTIYSNAIGYIHLILAEQYLGKLNENERVVDKKEENPEIIAEEYFIHALDINPSNKLVYANLCRLYATPYYIKEKDESYLELCRMYGYKAVRLDPEYINGHVDLASSLISYKQFDEAFDAYQKAIEKSSTEEKRNEIKNTILKKLDGVDESMKRKFELNLMN